MKNKFFQFHEKMRFSVTWVFVDFQDELYGTNLAGS